MITHNFRTPAAIGNQFRRKYVVPYQNTLDYIYNDNDKTFHITEGPVRAGKTTDNIIKFCIELEKSPEPLHLAIGKTQPTARTILWEGDGLVIAHYPDWKERTVIVNGKRVRTRQRIFKTTYEGKDALALLPKQGSDHPIKYIIAFGAENKVAHEPYKGYSVGSWIATQWELLHPETRSELLKRTIASRHRRHFIDLNPTSPKASIYKDIDRWIKNGDVNYMLKLMHDNPVLTPERIEMIKSEYDPESIAYKRDILGLRVAAEGLIYNVRDYNIIKEFNPRDYKKYVIVADIGEQSSATVFILLGLTRDNKHADVLKEYYHRNADAKVNEVKLSYDYAKDYQDFIHEVRELIGFVPQEILSDVNLDFVREFERTKYKANLGAVNINYQFKKDEIDTRVKEGQNYLYKGRLRFYKDCVYTIEAFRTATFDEKAKDKGKYVRYDSPTDGTMIDPIDAVEYGFARFKYDMQRFRG
jgi:PBSX family phage terminase large subunit